MLDLDHIEAPATVEDVEALYIAIEAMEDGADPEWLERATELKRMIANLLCELVKGFPIH